ncbi:MAG: hypothetical protein LUE96_07815 [Lachnospiraceae bacterium]|nr:hypothetical protein [Lachnospiraceae bacterium]
MSSLMATVGEDGTLQTTTTTSDSLTSSSSSSSNSIVDSDTFLTLLVAEMQNQDPLEPTSNTEWISQYATFTQVEMLSEMSDSMELMRASNLVGEQVIVKVTSSRTGDVTYARGTVDYITYEDGEAYLWIDGVQYSMDSLDTVISSEYAEAYDKYDTLSAMIEALPDVKYADDTYETTVKGAYEYYSTFSDYEKNFMGTYASDRLETLAEWKTALEALGIEFDDEDEETTSATLDDLLESFNTQTSAILEKLSLLTDTDTDTETEEEEESE